MYLAQFEQDVYMLTTRLVEKMAINFKGKSAQWWTMLLKLSHKVLLGRREWTDTFEV